MYFLKNFVITYIIYSFCKTLFKICQKIDIKIELGIFKYIYYKLFTNRTINKKNSCFYLNLIFKKNKRV